MSKEKLMSDIGAVISDLAATLDLQRKLMTEQEGIAILMLEVSQKVTNLAKDVQEMNTKHVRGKDITGRQAPQRDLVLAVLDKYPDETFIGFQVSERLKRDGTGNLTDQQCNGQLCRLAEKGKIKKLRPGTYQSMKAANQNRELNLGERAA